MRYRYHPVLYPPAAVLIVAAACATGSTEPAPPASSPQTPSSPQQRVTVMSAQPEIVAGIVDARTVQLSNGLEARILGLAAPDECWSATALKFTQDTLLGKQVRYSRASPSAITLRITNNDDFAALAVSKGLARVEKDDVVLTEVEKSAANAGAGAAGSAVQGIRDDRSSPAASGQDHDAPPPPPPPASPRSGLAGSTSRSSSSTPRSRPSRSGYCTGRSPVARRSGRPGTPPCTSAGPTSPRWGPTVPRHSVRAHRWRSGSTPRARPPRLAPSR